MLALLLAASASATRPRQEGRPGVKAALGLTAFVDGKKASGGWVYARVGQKVELRASLAGEKRGLFRWFKLEPTVESVDNTQPHFHFEPIRYQATELHSCRGSSACTVDVAPTVLPAVAATPGAGTMAFQLAVDLPDGSTLSSPGLEATVNGGLGPTVMRVTFRKDDTYLGYLTELINTPYIFGSAGPDGRNQSDLLIGSDCADLAIYGRRRMGKKATYTSSYAIDKQAPLVITANGTQSDGGVSIDAAGNALHWGAGPRAVAKGDLLHFPGSRHVAVLYEDRAPLGVLDANDLMIHTCWAPPRIEPIGASSCTSFPWRVLRFK